MGFSDIYNLKNLQRAYQWTLSNGDIRYKDYFREDYAAYALSSAHNLKHLSRQIRGGRFTPSHATKIYTPKASGILRPYTLLTVNDQIAYQACVNLVAEKLHPLVRKRHHHTVFFHIYAGKTSRFFYKKWTQSYHIYSKHIRSNFHSGYTYIATFDLTAFYDSIDHHVLKHFLNSVRVDAETIDFLLRCLRHWTDAIWSSGRGKPIFHEHGIPQGPSPSGMLSEVVLQHLDAIGDRRSKEARYLRYVDDIRIMAKSEHSLRRKLVALDIAAKEIGLFPQGEKISIRKIANPEDEIKSVSVPPEPAARPFADQNSIRVRIKALANRGNPRDTTRLKFVLPRLVPNHTTNDVLYKVLVNRPDLCPNIVRHFSQYKHLPKSLSAKLVGDALTDEVYHANNAEILNLLYGRIRPSDESIVADFAYERLFARKYRTAAHPTPQPSYRAALARWALKSGRMTYADYEQLVRHEADWWVLQSMLLNLDPVRFGAPSYQELLNIALRSEYPDPARVAGALAFSHSIAIRKPYDECHWGSRVLLREVGLIPLAGRPPSLVPGIIDYVLNVKLCYEWKRFFGADHTQAERIAIAVKQRYETDIDACTVLLDSFFDMMMRNLYKRNGSSMTANYGSVLKGSAPPWLRAQFPNLLIGLGKLHELRIRSYTAHPKHRTGRPNKRITHGQFFRVRTALARGMLELSRSLPL